MKNRFENTPDEPSPDAKVRLAEERLREAQERLRNTEGRLKRLRDEQRAEEQRLEEELEKRFGPSIRVAEAKAQYYRELAERLGKLEKKFDRK